MDTEEICDALKAFPRIVPKIRGRKVIMAAMMLLADGSCVVVVDLRTSLGSALAGRDEIEAVAPTLDDAMAILCGGPAEWLFNDE